MSSVSTDDAYFGERITEDKFIRVIDAFVDNLNCIHLGFIVKIKNHEGRPAYGLDTLIKLYIYGYLYSCKSRGKVQNTFNCYIADHNDCATCPLYNLCVSKTRQSRQKGKQIERSEFEDVR